MHDRALISITHGRWGSGFAVTVCPNGFQGTVAASGLHKREADSIALALLRAEKRKLLQGFDAETKRTAKSIRANGQNVEEYQAYRAEAREKLVARIRIDRGEVTQ